MELHQPIQPFMCSTWLAGSSTHAVEMSQLAGASRKQPGCRPGSTQRACVFHPHFLTPCYWLFSFLQVSACVDSALKHEAFIVAGKETSDFLHAELLRSKPPCACVRRLKPAYQCRLWVLHDDLGKAWDGEDHAAASHHARQLLAGPPGAGGQLPGPPLLTRHLSQASGLCTALLQHCVP